MLHPQKQAARSVDSIASIPGILPQVPASKRQKPSTIGGDLTKLLDEVSVILGKVLMQLQEGLYSSAAMTHAPAYDLLVKVYCDLSDHVEETSEPSEDGDLALARASAQLLIDIAEKTSRQLSPRPSQSELRDISATSIFDSPKSAVGQFGSDHHVFHGAAEGVNFEDVAGCDDAKAALREALVFPLQFSHLFGPGKLPTWKRILLFGPPGTGKTYLARATAGELQAKFFSVSSADLITSLFGESERLIRTLFAEAANSTTQNGLSAASARSAVIFIDEIDSLCRKRTRSDPLPELPSPIILLMSIYIPQNRRQEQLIWHGFSQEDDSVRRIKTTLLTEIEGFEAIGKGFLQGLLVSRWSPLTWDFLLLLLASSTPENGAFLLCATNCPWEIDPAFLRRFQRRSAVNSTPRHWPADC